MTVNNVFDYHYCYFIHGFKFRDSVCNACHDLKILCLNISNIGVITVKGVDFRCIVHDIRSSKINTMAKSALSWINGKGCEEYEGQKCLISIDAILDKVLDKIKEIISIERFHDVKILTDRDNRLAEDFTLKNVVNLITCAIRLYNKFHAQLFLEEVLFDN